MKRTALLILLVFLSFTPLTRADDDDDRPNRKEIPISTGKRLITPAPGAPRSTNSLPMTMALSPDKKWLAILNAGYGTKESGYKQSIAILNTETNEYRDFPDDRLGNKAKQSFFRGLAWSSDGQHVYASMSSITDPEGSRDGNMGNGIAVYTLSNGSLTPERFIKIPLQVPSPGKHVIMVDKSWPQGKTACYPAGIAVPSNTLLKLDHDRLVVACNLSDSVLVLNAGTGAVEHVFDVSDTGVVPGSYPYAVVTSDDGRQAWVSLWNSSRVVELHIDGKMRVVRKIDIHRPKSALAAGSHPSEMALSGVWLYVSLAASDEVAAIQVTSGKVKKIVSVRMPGQREHGNYPSGLAFTPWPDEKLLVANSAANAVAVVSVTATSAMVACPDECHAFLKDERPHPRMMGMQVEGFIPTEWYPTAVSVHAEHLYIATAKGRGQGPNSARMTEPGNRNGHPYIATLMHGSLARVRIADAEKELHALTLEVLHANRMDEERERFHFVTGKNPIKHVIYIIKENRTYDQVFGDITGANGDESLTLFGEQITPNHHALARQFGVLDNFYDSGEVSGSGHVWSTAAITSDYTEHTWQIGYRGDQRTYDYEGKNSNAIPLEHGIPDVNEPGTGYLWTNAARHKLTYRHYGEYVNSSWCAPDEWESPTEGSPSMPSAACPKQSVMKGEPLNGAPSPWPWPVPLLKGNVATKPELRDHFDPQYADFRIDYPDQLRADEFIRELNEHVNERAAGRDTLPRLIVMRLPNDHTAGTKVNMPTPAASVADNDLALGRVVEAVTHSPYWDDTAIFVLEDDAQDGADHVDAHRSIALVISKYSPHGRCAPDEPSSRACPFVDSRFYTTVTTVATMEALLGLPPMNNNDAHSSLMTPLFAGPGDQPPFKADYRNRDNGVLFQANKKSAPGAKASAELDLTHADAADPAILNAIVWHSIKGDVPMPEPVHNVVAGSQ